MITGLEDGFGVPSGPISGVSNLIYSGVPQGLPNVDILNIFSTSYDNYTVVIQGVKPSSTDGLLMRFANAGVVDTTSQYAFNSNFNNTTASLTTNINIGITATNTLNTGIGTTVTIHIHNTNSTSSIKSIEYFSALQSSATPTYNYQAGSGLYVSSNPISGIRFYWSGGSNFAVAGKIYVYGYSSV